MIQPCTVITHSLAMQLALSVSLRTFPRYLRLVAVSFHASMLPTASNKQTLGQIRKDIVSFTTRLILELHFFLSPDVHPLLAIGAPNFVTIF